MDMDNFDYDELVREFNAKAMRSKKAVLMDIDAKIRCIEQGRGVDTSHSAAFYERIKDLLLRFREKVRLALLFKELEDLWAYDVEIRDDGITLLLYHFDVLSPDDDEYYEEMDLSHEYTLVKENAKLLSVEKYAEVYGVTPGTVRQWIRRGKLRSAVKTGGEWRIPELAEVSGRGYIYGRYEWEDELPDLPAEYSFLNNYTHASITQDAGDRNLFHICCWIEEYDEEESYEVEMSSKEKEKFELMLISNPLIEGPNELKDIFLVSEDD